MIARAAAARAPGRRRARSPSTSSQRSSREIPAFRGKRLAGRALALLERYPFPGNVRELKNIIERAVYRDTTDEITPEDLGLHAQRPRAAGGRDLQGAGRGVRARADRAGARRGRRQPGRGRAPPRAQLPPVPLLPRQARALVAAGLTHARRSHHRLARQPRPGAHAGEDRERAGRRAAGRQDRHRSIAGRRATARHPRRADGGRLPRRPRGGPSGRAVQRARAPGAARALIGSAARETVDFQQLASVR